MKTWSSIAHRVLSVSLLLMFKVSANELLDKTPVIYTEVDYLLWFSNQDGLHSPTVATGESPNLDSRWSSGVRGAIGGQSTCWDIELCYTCYSTSCSNKVNADIETILTSTPSTAGIFEVGEKWNLQFNRLDLQLGRKLFFGDLLLLEPFLGLTGVDVSQKFNLTTQTAFLDLMTDLPATNIVDSRNSNSLLGVGPRAGFKANFDFKAGFGLYGVMGVNILWGRFKIKQDYNQTDYYSSSSSTVLVDQMKDCSQVGSIFNADLEIGLNWKCFFEKPNLGLELKAGWVYHYYTDMVRFQDFYLQQKSLGTAAYTTNGSLALSGLTAGVLLKY